MKLCTITFALLLFTSSVWAGDSLMVDKLYARGCYNSANGEFAFVTDDRPILRVDTVECFDWRGRFDTFHYDTTFVDTSRYYAVESVVYDTIMLYKPPDMRHPCDYWGEGYPHETIDTITTWFPKIEVLLTRDQYDRLMELLEPGNSNYLMAPPGGWDITWDVPSLGVVDSVIYDIDSWLGVPR